MSLAVRLCGVNVVFGINRPDVAFGKIRIRRAFFFAAEGRGVENLFAAFHKKRTGRSTFAVGNHLHGGTVNVHRINLVAFAPVAFRLKNQLRPSDEK